MRGDVMQWVGRLVAAVFGLGVLALLAAVSMPMLAHFPETHAALGPPSISLLVGAFVFGLCMQIADGCGSGTSSPSRSRSHSA